MTEFICRVVYVDDEGEEHTEIMQHVSRRADGGFVVAFPNRLYEQKLQLKTIYMIPDSESIHEMSYPAPLTKEELDFHEWRLNRRKPCEHTWAETDDGEDQFEYCIKCNLTRDTPASQYKRDIVD